MNIPRVSGLNGIVVHRYLLSARKEYDRPTRSLINEPVVRTKVVIDPKSTGDLLEI
jgi:hypothetical protein